MGVSSLKTGEYRLPIFIQQFHTNIGDDLALLILFDLLQLVSKYSDSIDGSSIIAYAIACVCSIIALCIRCKFFLGQIIVFDLEKQHIQKTSNSSHLFDCCCRRSSDMLLINVPFLEQIDTNNRDARTPLVQTSTSLSTLSNLLVSLLHPWSFDENIDDICRQRLQLHRTNRYISYGILSKNEHLSLILPTWQRHLNDHVPDTYLANPSTLISFIGMETNEIEASTQYVNSNQLVHVEPILGNCRRSDLDKRIASQVTSIIGDGNIRLYSIPNIYLV
jgi:hypothetical protein